MRMRHDEPRIAGWARFLVIGVVTGFLLALTPTSPAGAEPPPQDKAEIGRQVVSEKCAGMPGWDGLPDVIKSKIPDALKPQKVCEDVLYKNLVGGTPESLKAVCTAYMASNPITMGPAIAEGLGGLAGKATPLTDQCAQKIGGLLVGAQKVYEEKVKPVVEAVKQAVCAASEGLPCIVRQFVEMQSALVRSVWAGYTAVLTSPSSAVPVLDGLKVAPDKQTAQQKAFAATFRDVGLASAAVVFVVVLVSLVHSAVVWQIRPTVESLGGLLTWGMMWSAGIGICVLFLKLCDGLAVFFAGQPDAAGKTPLGHGADTFAKFVEATTFIGIPGQGSALASAVIGLIMLIALIAAVISLAFRDLSILLMALVLPLLLAFRAGPQPLREALPKWIARFVAIALAKPLMVLGMRLGSQMVAVPNPADPRMWTSVAVGVILLVIIAFSPGIIYGLFGLMGESSAGSRTGAGDPGLAQQGSQSMKAASSGRGGGGASGTRSVAQANAPRGGGVSAAGGGGGSAAGGAAGGGKAAGGHPALAAALMAVELASSAQKAAASQVGTAGGALADAEKGHVPNPGYDSRPEGQHQGGDGGAQGARPGPGQQQPRPAAARANGSGGSGGSPGSGGPGGRPNGPRPAAGGGRGSGSGGARPVSAPGGAVKNPTSGVKNPSSRPQVPPPARPRVGKRK